MKLCQRVVLQDSDLLKQVSVHLLRLADSKSSTVTVKLSERWSHRPYGERRT